MRNPAATSLVAAVIVGQVAYTVSWLIGPLWFAGYSPRSESTSALAAHGSPNFWPATIGMAFAAVSLVVACALAQQAHQRLLAATVGCLAIATALFTIFRDACEPSNAAWCAVPAAGAFARSDTIHAIAANSSFTLLIALPVIALAVRLPHRYWHAVAALLATSGAALNYAALRGLVAVGRGIPLRFVLIFGAIYIVALAWQCAALQSARK